MRLRLMLILLYLFAACPALHAAPAEPGPAEVRQPDGSIIKIVTRGDEFQNWVESEDTGHTIMRNDANGYWEYAEQGVKGLLKSSGIRVLPHGSNPPSLPKGLRPPRNKDHESQMNQMLQDIYQERVAASSPAITDGASAAPGDWLPAPVAGSRKLLIILVSFADRAIGTTSASWSTAVFDTTAKSVTKYYKENSFDSLTISPVPHSQPGSPPGVVSVSLATNHPNTGGSYSFTSDQTWGNSALKKVTDAGYVDFNSLDTNGDGKLSTSEVVIYFIAAGYETSASSGLTPSMWAHAWWTTGLGLTAGTKNVQRWALNGEYYNASTQMTMGVIAHELGHQMCGLPDLYDISGTNRAMGAFSVMASGSWGSNTGETGGATPSTLDAWSREFLGWGTPVTPSSGSTIGLNYALASSGSLYKFVLPATSTTEYFLMENRQPTSWDLGLKRFLGSSWTGGLLVTHIDNTAGYLGSNDINSFTANSSTPGHQGVIPVQASTAACNMLGNSCNGHATTLFYSGNKTSWTPATSPDSNYYSGASTGFSVTAVSAPAATMTATFSLAPTITITSSPAGNTNSQQGNFSFTSSDVAATLDCKVDAAAYTPCSSPYTTAILADGSHTFSVRATNSSGSSEASNTWTIDTVPPDTTLSSVPSNPTFATSAAFSFSSPDATATFQCQLDGSSFTTCTSGISYSGLSTGNHTFTVRAIDGAGNVDATPAFNTWTIDPCNVKIVAACYTTLGAAYAAASNGDTIIAQAVTLAESFAANRGIGISFRGGYNATFSSVIGFTTVQELTISNDSLDVAGLTM